MKKVIEGMGAIPADDGVGFRVWAPNADKVFLTGSFNDWKDDDIQLEKEDNGYWYAFAKAVSVDDEYKFIIHNGKEIFKRNDPYSLRVTNSIGNSIVTNLSYEWKTDSFKMHQWNTIVIYQAHVGSFFRESGTEDEASTFSSVIKKLDYLKELGINTLQLLPVAEFPGDISWGYNPAYPFAVESDYGKPEDLQKLVDEAHLKGIAVIIDVVYNHLGPSDLDLWQFDGWSENDGGGIYFYNDDRAETPWGATRLDYGREEVRNYVRDNALLWLEKYNCDGLRWDATSYIRYKDGGLDTKEDLEGGVLMIQEILTEISEKYPDKIIIAEDMQNDEIVTAHPSDGGLGFHSQWDSTFVHTLREELIKTSDSDRNIQAIIDILISNFNGIPTHRIIYTESHDEVANGKTRLPDEIQPGDHSSTFAMKRTLLGAILTLTAPGIPMIFQGQEFLTPDHFTDNEGLDWSNLDKYSGIQKAFKDLIHLRNDTENALSGLQGSEIEILKADNERKVITYYRYHNDNYDDGVLIILNLSSEFISDYNIGIPNSRDYEVIFNSDWEGYSTDFGNLRTDTIHKFNEAYESQPSFIRLNLAPYGGLILA